MYPSSRLTKNIMGIIDENYSKEVTGPKINTMDDE